MEHAAHLFLGWSSNDHYMRRNERIFVVKMQVSSDIKKVRTVPILISAFAHEYARRVIFVTSETILSGSELLSPRDRRRPSSFPAIVCLSTMPRTGHEAKAGWRVGVNRRESAIFRVRSVFHASEYTPRTKRGAINGRWLGSTVIYCLNWE